RIHRVDERCNRHAAGGQRAESAPRREPRMVTSLIGAADAAEVDADERLARGGFWIGETERERQPDSVPAQRPHWSRAISALRGETRSPPSRRLPPRARPR